LLGNAAPLPGMTRLSVSAPFVARQRLAVAATLEVVATRHSDTRGGGGAEATWSLPGGMSLALRAGAATHPLGSLASPITFGGGLRVNHLALDYAYQSFETFGATHRVGARWFR
ncbi:MAG: hypothetical protein M3081_04535, partial [Gemmatimonadota bacterium]|nr:hypothetical protein [Gemmatimonadota bacterium]